MRRCGYSATITCYHLNRLQSYFCSCTNDYIVCFVSLLFVVLLCPAIPIHVVTFLLLYCVCVCVYMKSGWVSYSVCNEN